MTPVEWMVDEDTNVRLEEESVRIRQREHGPSEETHEIELSPTGASAESLIRALLCAVEAAGWDCPDLSREGYQRATNA